VINFIGHNPSRFHDASHHPKGHMYATVKGRHSSRLLYTVVLLLKQNHTIIII